MQTPTLSSGIERSPSVHEKPVDAPDSVRNDSVPPRPSLKRRLKNLSKRGLRKLFEVGQHCGLDILPRHFYSEIPCIADLRRDDGWKLPRTMHGVSGNDIAMQFDFLKSCCSPELVSVLAHNDIHAQACARNGEPGFCPVDSAFLYGFIRTIRPMKIVQVGCGVSTAVILRAASDAGYRPELVCVEPYPTRFLHDASREEAIRLIAEKAQAVPLELLIDLGDEGFLFADSTHTVKPGSEVNRLVLEVLPRLRPGTWAHFHDIYFPYDYQRGILDDELFFSNESVLLHAFLIHNRACTIRVSLSMLHYADPDRLARSIPGYRPAANDHGLKRSEGHFPGSLYLQMCEG
jgi:hypothetical protein